MGQAPSFRLSLLGRQQVDPDAGPGPGLADAVGESAHRREVGVAPVPGPAVAGAASGRLPAVVDDHERTVAVFRRQPGDEGRVVENALGAVLAVIAVPVVEAVDRLPGQARRRAHVAAEGAGRLERRLAGFPPTARHRADGEPPRAEPDSGTAVADVRGERDAFRAGAPGAHGRGLGHDAVAVGRPAVARQEIPGHFPGRVEGLPFELAVGALPGVAQVFPILGGSPFQRAVMYFTAADGAASSIRRHPPRTTVATSRPSPFHAPSARSSSTVPSSVTTVTASGDRNRSRKPSSVLALHAVPQAQMRTRIADPITPRGPVTASFMFRFSGESLSREKSAIKRSPMKAEAAALPSVN